MNGQLETYKDGLIELFPVNSQFRPLRVHLNGQIYGLDTKPSSRERSRKMGQNLIDVLLEFPHQCHWFHPFPPSYVSIDYTVFVPYKGGWLKLALLSSDLWELENLHYNKETYYLNKHLFKSKKWAVEFGQKILIFIMTNPIQIDEEGYTLYDCNGSVLTRIYQR